MLEATLPELVLIPGRSFVMGNDAGRVDERPAHRVTVPAFRAAARPVSNREYRAFVEATGCAPPPFWDDERFAAAELPVVGVSWFDAADYCAWLSGLAPAHFRLPAEAERELAAFGGLEGVDWPWGAEPPNARPELAGIVRLDRPHVPGPECANGYGLRCMVDNVHEWCSDWYETDYYQRSEQVAPLGPASSRRRASRGGSWRHMIKFNRISARSSLNPSFHYNDYGFRVYS